MVGFISKILRMIDKIGNHMEVLNELYPDHKIAYVKPSTFLDTVKGATGKPKTSEIHQVKISNFLAEKYPKT